MLRKLSLVTAFTAILALTASESIAAPHGGRVGGFGVRHAGVGWGVRHAGVGWGVRRAGVGWGVRRFGVVHRPFFRRRFFVGAAAWPWYGYGYSCWRWRPTVFGWRRVWACGWPYYY
jgi:hypothetical protein